jgi:sugar fermentation stimulation protein A
MFGQVLIEGTITSRPNRFIMNVLVDGEARRCHCPTTGRVGDIIFKNIPCLVEQSHDPKRSTWGTVEAVSLDPLGKTEKTWIGIDQGRANDIVSFFIASGQLEDMLGAVKTIKREVKMGNSRIDFLINDDTLMEVKTPLLMLTVKGHPEHSSTKGFTSFERMMRHFTEISEHIPEGKRGIVLLCYIFDAPLFQVPLAKNSLADEMKASVRRATEKGVENWQANFKMDQTGVELLGCFKLDLFHEDAP